MAEPQKQLSNNQDQPQPFVFFGFTFASKEVLTQFCLFSFMVVVIPIIMVLGTHFHLKESPGYTEMERTVYTVVPSLAWMNIVIGIYIFKVIKDPENYKKDPSLKVTIKPKKE